MHLSSLHVAGLLSFGGHSWMLPPSRSLHISQHQHGQPSSAGCLWPAPCRAPMSWPTPMLLPWSTLAKAERSIPAVPPSIWSWGQPQDPYTPERDEFQAVFGKVKELLAFPHDWTAPSRNLSSRLVPCPAIVAWPLPRAAGLVLAPPSSRMGILIVGVWKTPPGWSRKLWSKCISSPGSSALPVKLCPCMAFCGRWAGKTPNSFYYIL